MTRYGRRVVPDDATSDPDAVAVDRGALAGILRVFRGNHRELEAAIAIREDPGEWLRLVSDRVAGQMHSDELDRLLFNYVASAYSLSASAWKISKRRWG